MQLQRHAMEKRLDGGNAGPNQAMASVPPPTGAQGFLTRTRQAAARGRATGINQHG